MKRQTDTCLIELGTEELPPKSLKSLAHAFADLVQKALENIGLPPAAVEVFATPRRLALLLREVPVQQADRSVEKRGPALQAAYDADGKPSRAAQGFASSCGVSVDQLVQRESGKGAWLYFEKTEAGRSLAEVLPELVTAVLAKLPIARRMRWGSGNEEFVRPLKWLVLMIGSELVEGEILGVTSTRLSYGHRFHAPGAIEITGAGEYESLLRSKGMVVANFEDRKSTIRSLVEHHAARLGGRAQIDEALLDEVTALVEYPVAICGEFDVEFLDLPQQVLVTTMQDNQKYFALFDQDGGLLPHFIAIANIDSKKPEVVARGNERVIRPRFSDARFFYQQDRKQSLASFRSRLDAVVFQKQLGSIGDKTDRIDALAVDIAQQLGVDETLVSRAAHLCKCDLMSDMVGEFPKLQGVMGRYYAAHDQEPERVSEAIEQHYWPRFAGDELPRNPEGQCLALADRLDSLLGIFAIGQQPSGVKDPFALRRAALGIVRILIEKSLPLDLNWLCARAVDRLKQKIDAGPAVADVIDYIFDRLKAYYQDQGIPFDIVDAVIYSRPTLLYDCDRRVQALYRFQSNEAAIALAAANKRIANMLKKNKLSAGIEVDASKLQLAAEKKLYQQLGKLQVNVERLFSEGLYLEGLNQLANLRPAVDRFFDEVMVMVEDESVKNNRLALLDRLMRCFRTVADFSRIQS
ncbi:MAG: glycine--tRNA ligase subunit beta [Proteobacteria bacterium]|nr:glycine--tRNA ligase subunit beta [Pseudomonadota bacterium]